MYGYGERTSEAKYFDTKYETYSQSKINGSFKNDKLFE